MCGCVCGGGVLKGRGGYFTASAMQGQMSEINNEVNE